jgi:hypothetical protein
LEQHQKQAPELVDFDFDLKNCTWDDVLIELERAQAAALASEKRGKKIWKSPRKLWRIAGAASDVIGPVLEAIPDELCVLHAGLAVIFSVRICHRTCTALLITCVQLARHSAQNRMKILRAFEDIPNVIHMAQKKSRTFPLDDSNPESVRLHESVGELQKTLLRSLPDLIERLNPGTFRECACMVERRSLYLLRIFKSAKPSVP